MAEQTPTDTYAKIFSALKIGAMYTGPVLPLMNIGFQTGKVASARGIPSHLAFRVVHRGSFINLFRGLDVLAGQQSLRIFGKASILAVGLPYAQKHYPRRAKVLTTAALTLMDGCLTPIETHLTRIYNGQPTFATFTRYYRGTFPQVVRHGYVWGTYMMTKSTIDKLYSHMGGNPDTILGALATAPAVAGVVTLPMQPFYVLEARRQSSQDKEIARAFSSRFFKNVDLARTMVAKEGVRSLWRGFWPTALGITGLAIVANNLVLHGKKQAASSGPTPS